MSRNRHNLQMKETKMVCSPRMHYSFLIMYSIQPGVIEPGVNQDGTL